MKENFKSPLEESKGKSFLEKIRDFSIAISFLASTSYLLGFLIWSVYLARLKFVELDLLQGRYILTGSVFILCLVIASAFLVSIYVTLNLVFFPLIEKLKPTLTKFKVFLKDVFALLRKNFTYLHKFQYSVILLLIFFILLILYAQYLLPHIPVALGGAQPRAISLIAKKETLDFLQHLDIPTAKGSNEQTNNVCVVYEGPKYLIVIRENRVITLDKGLIIGYGALPIAAAKMAENVVCLPLLQHWLSNPNVSVTQ